MDISQSKHPWRMLSTATSLRQCPSKWKACMTQSKSSSRCLNSMFQKHSMEFCHILRQYYVTSNISKLLWLSTVGEKNLNKENNPRTNETQVVKYWIHTNTWKRSNLFCSVVWYKRTTGAKLNSLEMSTECWDWICALWLPLVLP